MLKLYNTLTKKKEIFKPLKKGEVRIYSCGPTVYNYAHIGNLSTYLSFDLLKRYLRYSGYKVIDVINLTDVDDKTIKASQRAGKPLNEYTSFFAKAFIDDLKTLNIKEPKFLLKATDHIKEIINLIEILIKKGYAYQSEDGSVYYKISVFRDYGKLAKLKNTQLKLGASGRVNADDYDKDNVCDFVLWKAWDKKDKDVYWDSPFGKGRPGWHIECSAMSMKYLGETIDIHTGGADLTFPHHENEIAQSEAATGKKFVRFWLHRGFLNIGKEKMSKRLGNIYTLKDVLEQSFDPMAFRYLVLTSQYRSNLDFTFNNLESALNSLQRLRSFIKRVSFVKGKKEDLRAIKKYIEAAKKEFLKNMDDDLNSPKAIAGTFDFITKINKLIDKERVGKNGSKIILKYINEIDLVWGFLNLPKESINKEFSKKVNELIKIRNKYRAEKEWQKADEIRDKLLKMNIIIKDENGSTKWEIK